MGGADIGINDVVNRVTSKAKECPNQKFALVGYSQGGMVVNAAATKIPTDLREKVVALVLYGAGNGAGGGPKGGSSPSSDIKQKTMANCAPGDMVSFHGCLKRFWFLTSSTSAVRSTFTESRCHDRSSFIR